MAVQPYSFAVVDEKTTVVSHVFWSSYPQSESMISLIEDAMTRQSLSFDQLEGVGVVVGPGQYTGIRMGVTMAKSIAMGLSIPIIGIGGIASAEDAIEFILAGADLVQIGTLNYKNPNIGIEIKEDLIEKILIVKPTS